MSKLWVDPPSGWKFGFPKIYDDEVDGDITEWLVANGCPKDCLTHYRLWAVADTTDSAPPCAP